MCEKCSNPNRKDNVAGPARREILVAGASLAAAPR